MGLFDKIKKIFKREEKDENEEILEKENLKEALKLGLKAFDGEVSCDEN